MKKLNSERNNSSGFDFWEPAADMFLALIFILILIIALLLLFVLHLPELEESDVWGIFPTEYVSTQQPENGDSVWENDGEGGEDGDYKERGEGDSEGEGGSGYKEDEYHFEYPYPSAGGGVGDDWGKAAVYANIIDGETGRAIKEAGVTFELYQVYSKRNGKPQIDPDDLHGAIRYLNTYYPKKIEYKSFKTTSDGNYYLPEKIEEGGYYFKEITEPKGYDASDLVYYELEQNYDWNDPYTVSIPLYPSKNVVRVELKDAQTGELVKGGSFNVTAAEEIKTMDDTVRFNAFELADTFSADQESGIATSSPLYLGKYSVSQAAAPEFYTGVTEVAETEVVKKNGIDPTPIEFLCEKTGIVVNVADDLYPQTKLEGAGFRITSDVSAAEAAQSGATVDAVVNADAYGDVRFTNLLKNHTYKIYQVSSAEGYRFADTVYEFTVDENGYINGEATAKLDVSNYIPRVAISLQDVLLKAGVSDKNVSLYNAQDQLIRSWTTTGATEVITGLNKGDYYILVDNKPGSRFDFTVENAEGITNVNHEIWTIQSIFTLVTAFLLIPLFLYGIFMLFGKVFKKKR